MSRCQISITFDRFVELARIGTPGPTSSPRLGPLPRYRLARLCRLGSAAEDREGGVRVSKGDRQFVARFFRTAFCWRQVDTLTTTSDRDFADSRALG